MGSFRQFLEHCGRDRVDQLLDDGEFSFFFAVGDDVFGAPEEGRIAFARMRHPDDDDRLDDMGFVAMNLKDLIKGEGSQRVFSGKSIKKIKVIDRDEAAKRLKCRECESK
jgi:hypothetical protein